MAKFWTPSFDLQAEYIIRIGLTQSYQGFTSAQTLQWRHNGRDSVSNHQRHDCLLNRSFRRRSKKTPKLRVTGLCAGNSPGTGEVPAQRASNAENVSIWWRHHVKMNHVNFVTFVLLLLHDNCNMTCFKPVVPSRTHNWDVLLLFPGIISNDDDDTNLRNTSNVVGA